MVGSRFGVGVDGYGACPEFLRSDAGEVDGGHAIHSGRLVLAGYGGEGVGGDYSDA